MHLGFFLEMRGLAINLLPLRCGPVSMCFKHLAFAWLSGMEGVLVLFYASLDFLTGYVALHRLLELRANIVSWLCFLAQIVLDGGQVCQRWVHSWSGFSNNPSYLQDILTIAEGSMLPCQLGLALEAVGHSQETTPTLAIMLLSLRRC